MTKHEKQTVDRRRRWRTAAAASPVYVGTGAETTREVIRLTKMAEKEGADGVSVITPYFIKPTQAELIDHFRRVAESTKLPVVLYNNPATCGGVSIEPETVATRRGAEHHRHQGLVRRLAEHDRDHPQHAAGQVRVLNGRDTLILAALQAGGAGGDSRVVQHRAGTVRRHLRDVHEGRLEAAKSHAIAACTRSAWR